MSTSNIGGQPEYHTIASVSKNGSVVTLDGGGLATAKIGEAVETGAAWAGAEAAGIQGAGGGAMVDMRAFVTLLSRNVEFRGGDEYPWDWRAPIGPHKTQYGATIRLNDAYEEERPGWDSSMVRTSLALVVDDVSLRFAGLPRCSF